VTPDLTVLPVPSEVSDPLNARILAVSEDRIAGFVEEPFAEIAAATGLSEDVVIERLRAMLAERNVTLVLDDSAKELLSREGYDPSFGARPLKRAIQTLIQNPMAMKLLRGEIQPGQTVTVSARNDEMVFATNKVAAAA